MALIFSPSVRSAFAYQALGSTELLSTYTRFSIFSGVQPSSTNFLTNFNATYSNTGTACLAEFSGILWTRSNNSWSITTFPSPVTPRLAGTATFAVIYTGTQTLSSGSVILSTPFIIVPVTTTAGNGVIRFSTTNFTTSTAMAVIDGGFSIL